MNDGLLTVAMSPVLPTAVAEPGRPKLMVGLSTLGRESMRRLLQARKSGVCLSQLMVVPQRGDLDDCSVVH